MTRLVLASTSRYRRELLGRLGLPFETIASAVDESPHVGEPPATLAERLAKEKAERAAELLDSRDTVILAADQTAGLGKQLLRKPGSHSVALEQLRACQGQSVAFYTAAAVLDTRTGSIRHEIDITEVRFCRRDTAALVRYLEIEQPYDCAGGFKAEGLGIALFESIVSRDPTALIGLPLIWVSNTLAGLGFDPLASEMS